MKRPYKHLDIPRQHLTADMHYVPPKARSGCERERRQGRLSGTLLAEYELHGVLIARHLIERAEGPEAVRFVTQNIAAAAFNNAWYRKAQNSSRMRKVAMLPMLAVGEEEVRPTARDIREQTKDGFSHAYVAAHGLLRAYEERARDIQAHRIRFANVIGDASLTLAAIEIGDEVRHMTPYMTQVHVRDQGLRIVGRARSLGAEIGSHPSLAQLPDPDSDFSVYIRRNAPDQVYEAYNEAIASYAIPR